MHQCRQQGGRGDVEAHLEEAGEKVGDHQLGHRQHAGCGGQRHPDVQQGPPGVGDGHHAPAVDPVGKHAEQRPRERQRGRGRTRVAARPSPGRQA